MIANLGNWSVYLGGWIDTDELNVGWVWNKT